MKFAASLILLMIAGASAPGQGTRVTLKNGDFERWVGDEPAGWQTTSIPKVCVVVSPSRYAHDGKFAARLEVKECFGSAMPGMITQKDIPLGPGQYRMTFKYRLEPLGGDVGYVTMEFRNKEGSTIRVCEERLMKGDAEWETFVGTFPAPSEAAAADFRVALLAGRDGGSLHPGTSLILDDIVLRSLAPESEEKKQ